MADVKEITRTVEGVELPLVGTYALDVAHSQVGFAVRHMAVSKVRGRFTKFDGTIQVAEDPTQSSVNVTIDATSVDTQDETRNNHLRTNDFFDVENHPTWTFVSTSVVPDGKKWKVTGDLTIRGITRPVTLETSLEGVVKDPYGNLRAGFSATAEIDREDFDVSFGAVMDAGGLVVAKKVTIEIDAEAVLQA
ncbi:MAG TPA: YceI family protein [Acidimicrobiales bacterium]|jgi:polyisoprenoid-binding protein YceI|nr:YceI family protein [Acidimicrobiales bacterium]